MQKMKIKSVFCVLLCAVLCVLGCTVSSALQDNAVTVPAPVHAGAAILIEAESGRVLYEQHAHTRMPMASTTKIMTALVVLETRELTETVCVDARAVGVEGSSIYLYEGEALTVEQLLHALMLSSANDAAAALAYYVAGSIEGFAALMNQKAAALGLANTQFANPHGLDAKGHYTSAFDLARLTAYALENEDFLRIVSTEKKVIPLREQQGARVLRNHNKLLSSLDGCIGVKTGFTKKSGRCLVSAAEREGVRLVCVTLDCPDDWKTHTALHESGFAAYERVTLADADSFVLSLPVTGGTSGEVYLQTCTEVALTLPRNRSEITCTLHTPHFSYAPVKAGEPMGEAIWRMDGEIIARAPLYAMHDVQKAEKKRTPFSWLRTVFETIKGLIWKNK